jgi:hypothetical protein
VTISAVDLGTGYEQVAANPVATQPGSGDLLASWDVVSQRAVPGSSTYRLVESILVVYPSVAGAAQELDNQRRTETARGAVVRTGVQLVGDDSEVWVEQVPARPSLRLVRISWRKENLVSQVSVLGPIATTPDGEAIALAQAQEVRLER